MFDLFNDKSNDDKKREEIKKRNPELDPWQIDMIMEGLYEEDSFEEEVEEEDDYYYDDENDDEEDE